MIDKNGLDYYNYSIISNEGKTVFEDKGKDYLTDKLSDYALEFIEKRQKEQPFFLYLCYSAPHVLLVPRADKLGKYFWKTEKFGEKYNPNYAAMIESVDDGVGRILATLDTQGLLDNTLIVFTSDNGHVGLPELGPTPAYSDILRKWKGHVYEGGIRIPAIWFWKGTIQPSVTPQYFTHTDYIPTFLEMLGQNHAVTPDGKSIWQVAQNPEKPIDRGALYWHYPHFSNQGGKPYGAMRLGDWKLVESYETNKIELYNLANDMGEKINLAKKNKKKTRELYQMLVQWRQEVAANMPVRKKG
jgi:arylsulfatase A-like enzyme